MEAEISSLKGRREMKKHPGSGTEPHLGCSVRCPGGVGAGQQRPSQK